MGVQHERVSTVLVSANEETAQTDALRTMKRVQWWNVLVFLDI